MQTGLNNRNDGVIFMDINEYKKRIKRVVIPEDEIKEAIKKAGRTISEGYSGSPVLLVSILKGAFVFLSDICRAVDVPCEVDFMEAKSYYENTQSSGSVAITMDLKKDIKDRDVVIVEDIIDTGRTLSEVIKLLKARGPRSLKVVTLLDKPSRRVVPLEPDLSLFTIPDYFVIGYGLDYGEYYRNLPYIAEFDDSGI